MTFKLVWYDEEYKLEDPPNEIVISDFVYDGIRTIIMDCTYPEGANKEFGNITKFVRRMPA